MAVGLPYAVALVAQVAAAPQNPTSTTTAYGPEPSIAVPLAKPTPERECANQNKDPNGNEIVVCAIKPEGYRLPPDIVEARRLKKEGITGPPRNPHEAYLDRSCMNVGPIGCRGTPTIDLISVALTAAEISRRLASGQEIGSVFETQKSSTDYQLYQLAKKQREEREAAAAAQAVRDRAKAAASIEQPKPAPSGGN